MANGEWLRGAITATRTLSILPVPGSDSERISSSLPWFGLVGGVLGAILYGVSLSVDQITGKDWPEVTALAVLVVGILLTNGFHLDGLADWADGFYGARDRKKILAIMKDSHIGAFGGIALIVILLAKWIALTRLVAFDLSIWVIAAYVVSRTMQVELAVSQPYARSEGGTGAPFVEDARFSHSLWGIFSSAILLLVFFGPAGLILLGIGWLICKLFGLWCFSRVGGVTGDLLGACSEIIETTIFILCAVFGKGLVDFSGWRNFL